MNHSFNVEIAVKLGVEKAVLLENISFWINRNKANGKHFHDGETWTYNSTKALAELFPYFNQKKLSRMLSQLETECYIKSGNYNHSAYDRTKWYTVVSEWVKTLYLPISKKREMELPEAGNGFVESRNSNNTDINTNINNINTPLPPKWKKKGSRKKEFKDYLIEKISGTDLEKYKSKMIEFVDYRMLFPANKKYKSEKSINGLIRDVSGLVSGGLDPVDCMERAMENNWQSPKIDYFNNNKGKNNGKAQNYAGNDERPSCFPPTLPDWAN